MKRPDPKETAELEKRMRTAIKRMRMPRGARAYDFLDELRANRAEELERERRKPGRQIGLFGEED